MMVVSMAVAAVVVVVAVVVIVRAGVSSTEHAAVRMEYVARG